MPAQRLLEFWFGAPGSAGFGQSRQQWFIADPGFDSEIRNRFATDYEAARDGRLDSWGGRPDTALALTILLDQVPRNIFRGTALAFATDGRAQVVAEAAVAAGFDRAVAPIQRLFFYLPFEHSETLVAQNRSIALVEMLAEDGLPGYLPYAIKHRDVIVAFGRFPHRNVALERTNTPEEETYLRANPKPF